MPIDTLRITRRLQEEGTFDEDQAERIAEVLSEPDVASATKEDLDDLEERLTARLGHAEERASLEERLTGRLDEVEERLTGRINEAEERLTGRIAQRVKKASRTSRQRSPEWNADSCWAGFRLPLRLSRFSTT